MIEKNWRAIVLSLLAVNLVFMALLELQRRTIWDGEREYFTRIEQTITTTDKTQASYDILQRQQSAIHTRLVGMDARVNNLEIKVEDVPASAALTRDILERVNNLEIKVQEAPASAALTRDISARVNNLEIKVQEAPASAALTRDILARVNSLQIAVDQMSAAKK
jgi:uncharacterized protein YjdB